MVRNERKLPQASREILERVHGLCALDCQALRTTSLFAVDINNNVTVPQSSDTSAGEETPRHFFKIL